MSKRHTISGGENWHAHVIPADIPFREDLVFYAPMENPYCCCDYISSTVPTQDTNNGSTTEFGTAVWDENQSMYKCRCQQGNSNVTQFLASLTWRYLQLFTNDDPITSRGYTLFMQTYQTACRSNRYINWLICDELRTAWPNADGRGNGETTSTTMLNIRGNSFKSGGGLQTTSALTTLSKVALTFAPDKTIKRYLNGSPTPREPSGSAPNNMHTNPTTVAIMQLCRGGNYEENYIKDVRVYNRALSQTEVQQL